MTQRMRLQLKLKSAGDYPQITQILLKPPRTGPFNHNLRNLRNLWMTASRASCGVDGRSDDGRNAWQLIRRVNDCITRFLIEHIDRSGIAAR